MAGLNPGSDPRSGCDSGPGAERDAARTHVFGVDIDVIDAKGAVARIVGWCRDGARGYVVTANVDHTLILRRDPAFRAAYAGARMVLADGNPLVWASRLPGPGDGPRLPERVAGSDLIRPLCAAAARDGLSVFLLGSTLDTLAGAARRLAAETPALQIAGVYAPPFGFGPDAAENAEIAAFLAGVRPDILLIALGAPKQEIWAHRWIARLEIRIALCVGASLDFIAGTQVRAPRWVRSLGLEWLHRALSQPARLGPRYLRNLIWLPRLIAEQLLANRRR